MCLPKHNAALLWCVCGSTTTQPGCGQLHLIAKHLPVVTYLQLFLFGANGTSRPIITRQTFTTGSKSQIYCDIFRILYHIQRQVGQIQAHIPFTYNPYLLLNTAASTQPSHFCRTPSLTPSDALSQRLTLSRPKASLRVQNGIAGTSKEHSY